MDEFYFNFNYFRHVSAVNCQMQSKEEQRPIQIVRQCFYTVLHRRDVPALQHDEHLWSYVEHRLPQHIRVLADHVPLADARQLSLVLNSACTCHTIPTKERISYLQVCCQHKRPCITTRDKYVIINLGRSDLMYEGSEYVAEHNTLPSIQPIATLLGVSIDALPVRSIQVVFDHNVVAWPAEPSVSDSEEEEQEGSSESSASAESDESDSEEEDEEEEEEDKEAEARRQRLQAIDRMFRERMVKESKKRRREREVVAENKRRRRHVL
jgi:hypothetical protein